MEQANDTVLQVRGMLHEKATVIEQMKQLVIAKNQKILDFTEVGSDGYTEYIEGLFIKNVTSPFQHLLGVTILHSKVEKEVEFQLHEHENQSQTIYVISGKIVELENNITFTEGQSYFISKNKKHSIRYYKDSEIIAVYLPNLNTIK